MIAAVTIDPGHALFGFVALVVIAATLAFDQWRRRR